MIIIGAAVTLYQRVPVKVDVIRDRANVAYGADEPVIENVYRLQLMNTDESAREFSIAVSGLEDMRLVSDPQPLHVAGASNRVVPVRVQVGRAAAKPGSNRIEFTIRAAARGKPEEPALVIREKATFVVQAGSPGDSR
jgi:polyferredoxin